MSTSDVTPFIPPLGTPNPSPGRATGMLPPNPQSQYPGWGRPNGGNYPMTPQQYTPFGSAPYTPFGPPTSAVPSGGYTPNTRPEGLSNDYTGYPDAPPTPEYPQGGVPQTPATSAAQQTPALRPMHHQQHPPQQWGNTPGPPWNPTLPQMGMGWGNTPAPAPAPVIPPMATPWSAAYPPQPYPVQAPPASAFPGAFPGVQQQSPWVQPGGFPAGPARPQGWFPPGPQGGFPPGPSIPPPHPTTWGANGPWMAAQNTPGIPVVDGFGGQPAHDWGAPPAPPAPDRPGAAVGDRLDPFMAGSHHGPVLSPFEVKILKATLHINPLIQPPTGDRPFLKWNMVAPPSTCQLSTDPPHMSWSTGRDQPATFPRVTLLRLVCSRFLFMLEISATDPFVGVTCGDVIDKTYTNLRKLTAEGDFKSLPTHIRSTITEAYRFNRSTAVGAPGGSLGQPMCRLDFMCRHTVFHGLRHSESLAKQTLGVELPCTFELQGERQLPLTAQEAQEQDARMRAAEETARLRAEALHREADDAASSHSGHTHVSGASGHSRGAGHSPVPGIPSADAAGGAPVLTQDQAEERRGRDRRDREAERRARDRSRRRSRPPPIAVIPPGD